MPQHRRAHGHPPHVSESAQCQPASPRPNVVSIPKRTDKGTSNYVLVEFQYSTSAYYTPAEILPPGRLVCHL